MFLKNKEIPKSIVLLVALYILLGIFVIKINNDDRNTEEYETTNNNVTAKELNDKIIKYEEEIEILEEELKLYEKSSNVKNADLKQVNRDINKYKIISGYTDVIGPGIIINISDKEESEVTSIDDIGAILKIISVLNSAGAEAISINGERYTSLTEIERASNHLVINGRITAFPLEIKAIGKPDLMKSAMMIKGGLYDYYRDILKLDIKLETFKEVKIEKIDRSLDIKYISPVLEEEKDV